MIYIGELVSRIGGALFLASASLLRCITNSHTKHINAMTNTVVLREDSTPHPLSYIFIILGRIWKYSPGQRDVFFPCYNIVGGMQYVLTWCTLSDMLASMV